MKNASMPLSSRPLVLTIAGFDPCGGAGLIADCKTFESLNTLGMAVNTAQTIQNDSQFDKVVWMSEQHIKEQIAILFDSYQFSAVKIGLVESLSVLNGIIKQIRSYNKSCAIVWDPVLKASAGFTFHSSINQELKREVMDCVQLVTPNWDEAKVLFSLSGEELESDVQTDILLKGGHRDNKRGTDILYTERTKVELEGEMFKDKRSKHGTGCILSSAIVAYLAKGSSMIEACRLGKQFVEERILSNDSNLAYFNL